MMYHAQNIKPRATPEHKIKHSAIHIDFTVMATEPRLT